MISSLSEELKVLFDSKQYISIVNLASDKNLSPSVDPVSSNIVAAALFQLSRFEECLLWCEGLSPSFSEDPSFSSMYGATLRRLNRIDEAKKVFRSSLSKYPDNPALKNNYANLLIDSRQYQSAKNILTDLLSDNPLYEDARVNLERVNFYETSNSRVDSSSHSTESSSLLDDPLAFAFSDDEVVQAGGLPLPVPSEKKVADQTKSLSDLLSLSDIAVRSSDDELSELVSLIRHTSSHDVQQSLRDLNALHKKYGCKSFLYELAAEVYIKANSFDKAKYCSLVSLQLGASTPSIYLNLANIAFMKGDQLLATHWLEFVSTHFPDCEQLPLVKKQLLANGLPKSSTKPFDFA